MATVRFSNELVNEIERNARAKMNPAIARAKEQTLDNAWGQRIYDILFLEAKPLIAQVPAEWLKTVDKITISRVANSPCDMTFTFATPQPWPHKFLDTKLAKRDGSWSDDITLRDDPVWAEFLAEVTTYRERTNVASQRQREFVDMVKKVCGAYTTLAPALKAWPPLWELIPENYKDKHRQVVEREKKEVKLDVDINKLTALSTAAKFGI